MRGKGKALVRWMEDQASVLTELWEKGVPPDKSSGESGVVVPRTSDVLNGPANVEMNSIANHAAASSSSASSSSSSLIRREPPVQAVDKPKVLPDLWWRLQEPVNIELLTVENCTLEQAQAYAEGQQYWRVFVDDNLAMVLGRIRQALWDENFRQGWIVRPLYEGWPVGFSVYPNFVVRWMSGGSRMEGRLGYESTRERALVWVGHH